jgi:hypothetical protein
MKRVTAVFLILVLIAMAGCAPGPNRLSDAAGEKESAAGFWKGLWHGFIVLFTFIVSLFSDSVRIYEVNNTGGWYDFGFLLGVMIFFGGSGSGACKKSSCK